MKEEQDVEVKEEQGVELNEEQDVEINEEQDVAVKEEQDVEITLKMEHGVDEQIETSRRESAIEVRIIFIFMCGKRRGYN